MEKVQKLFHSVRHRIGGPYTPISTLDPNDIVAERLRTSRSNGRIAKPLEPIAGHTNTINTMAVVRSGMVLSGSKDGNVVLTNTDSGEIHQYWDTKSDVIKLCYRNYIAKHSLITGTRDGVLNHWMFVADDPSIPNATFNGHTFQVSGVASLDENQFMSGSRDCTVRLWDIETSTQVRSQYLNRNMCTHMAYNCQKNLVAQTSEDKSLRLWDPRTVEVAVEFSRKTHIQMYCEFGGENRIFTCSNGFNNNGCEISSYDTRYPRTVKEVRGHEGNVTSLAVVHLDCSKKLLASVAADRTIRLWKIEESGEDVLRPIWSEEVPLEADNLQVCTYPDGHIIVSGGKGRLMHYQTKVAAQRVILDVQLIQKPKALAQSSSANTISR